MVVVLGVTRVDCCEKSDAHDGIDAIPMLFVWAARQRRPILLLLFFFFCV